MPLLEKVCMRALTGYPAILQTRYVCVDHAFCARSHADLTWIIFFLKIISVWLIVPVLHKTNKPN